MRLHSTAILAALLATPSVAGAQSLCRGNGIGQAYVVNTPLITGRLTTLLFGSPAAPFGFASTGLSDGLGPTNLPLPGFGNLCLDLNSGALAVEHFLLDSGGSMLASFQVPDVPALATLPPLYALVAVFDPAGVSIPKAVRFQWELPDAWDPLPLSETKAYHTATPLFASPTDNDPRVFVAGGATGTLVAPVPQATTWLFDPLTRTWTPGPLLSLPRSGHAAVRLGDGRILLTGGCTTSGIGTATCDAFDPATGTITPVAPMQVPRLGHALTLLGDGRVLASGGFGDWQNAATNFAARLSTAHSTTEIYDPAANAWTPGPAMASARGGHTQTRLPDGRILLVGGVAAGQTLLAGGTTQIQVPVFTATCELFDPATNGFTATAPLALARGYHAATVLANGDVLVTGGAASIGSYGAAACSTSTATWDGSLWTNGPGLPTGVAFHTQVFDAVTGGALLMGGFTAEFGFSPASPQSLVHSGPAVTAASPIGTGPGVAGRGGHTCTALQDGTFLVFGGQDPVVLGQVTTLGSSYVHVR